MPKLNDCEPCTVEWVAKVHALEAERDNARRERDTALARATAAESRAFSIEAALGIEQVCAEKAEAERDRYREHYRVESLACHDAQVQRDYLLGEQALLKGVRDAAEAFLDYKCNCATLADQGCICSVCLLKERFAALAPSSVRCETCVVMDVRMCPEPWPTETGCHNYQPAPPAKEP